MRRGGASHAMHCHNVWFTATTVAIYLLVTTMDAFENGTSIQDRCTQYSDQDGATILLDAVWCTDTYATSNLRSCLCLRSNKRKVPLRNCMSRLAPRFFLQLLLQRVHPQCLLFRTPICECPSSILQNSLGTLSPGCLPIFLGHEKSCSFSFGCPETPCPRFWSVLCHFSSSSRCTEQKLAAASSKRWTSMFWFGCNLFSIELSKSFLIKKIHYKSFTLITSPS